MKQPTIPTLVYTWLGLLALLALTFGVYFVNLGTWNTLLAFGIAIAKTVLVLLFFMHLRYGANLTRVLAGAGFFWLTLLLCLILTDYAARHPEVFSFGA